MKRQGGFTLIELVVVIVILGILAVTAAPKFLSMQDDARKASLEGLKGAISGAAGITYGRAAIEGKEAVSSATTTKGSIPVAFGYPKATEAALGLAVTGLADDWVPAPSSAISGALGTDPTQIAYTFKGYASRTEIGCYVIYTEADDADTPASTKVVTGNGCQ